MFISSVLNIKILSHKEYIIVTGKLICIRGTENRNYWIDKYYCGRSVSSVWRGR